MSEDDIPNFDEDPTINTVSQLYQKQRPAFRGLDTKAEMENHFGPYFGSDDYNPIGTNDIVQPCGCTDEIFYEFFVNYKNQRDINILFDLLEKHPVYGSQEISKELKRLLKKTRIKPISNKKMETEVVHQAIREYFSLIDPKRGEVEAAYQDIIDRLEEDFEVKYTINNVRNIIRRARKSGWDGEFDRGLNINKGSCSDSA